MLTRSLAVRLDFDMRILPATTLYPLITSFTSMLLCTARAILDLPSLTDDMLAQAQLPGSYGGLFPTSPFIKLQVAHLASLSSAWSHTYKWLQSQGR